MSLSMLDDHIPRVTSMLVYMWSCQVFANEKVSTLCTLYISLEMGVELIMAQGSVQAEKIVL